MMDASASGDLSLTNSGLSAEDLALSEEEKKRQEAALLQELQEVEKEIVTLKTVLSNKVKRANEIKRKLGITMWSEVRDTAKSGITDLKDSNAYKSTVQAAQVAKEKTSGMFSSAKEKIANVTTSSTFKSFGDRVGSAYSSVKQSQSFMDFRSHTDKLKTNTTAETSGDSGPSNGAVTLDAAISADKKNKQPAGSASVSLSAPDSK